WHAWTQGDTLEILVAGERCVLQPYANRSPSQASESGLAAAPMPGVVVALPVAVGAPVRVGTVLAIVEAMKMEHKVLAQVDGRVDAVHCRVGENIAAGQLLVSV